MALNYRSIFPVACLVKWLQRLSVLSVKSTHTPRHGMPSKSWKRLLPFFVVGAASLFYVYEFFLRVIPSAIEHELMRDLKANAASLGLMSSAFYWAYALMQIPAGLLCDRFGPKRIMSIALSICCLSTLLFALIDDLHVAALSRGLIGFAASCGFIAPLMLVGRWFAHKYFAMITGAIQFLGCLGAMIGGKPIAILSETLGWRQAIILAAGIGFLLLLIILLIVKDHPKGQKITEKTYQNGQVARLKKVCQQPQSWAAGIIGLQCWAPIAIFELWGIPFIRAWHHTSSIDASGAMVWMWLGIGIASPLIGWWSNHIKKRKVPIYVLSILSSTACILIITHPWHSWTIMNFSLFALGVSAGAQPIAFAIMNDIHPKSIAGTAVGFTNMAVIAGGPILQPLVGFLLQNHWHGTMIDGAPYYTLHDYHSALAIMPLCGMLGLLTALFWLKETRCQPQYIK